MPTLDNNDTNLLGRRDTQYNIYSVPDLDVTKRSWKLKTDETVQQKYIIISESMSDKFQA